MKWLDLPPIWLLGCVIAAWLGRSDAGSALLDGAGWLLLVVAVVLVIAAVLRFHRARTTIVPHQTPTTMISDGVFSITRNPIYLADVLVLAGLSLIWSSWIGALLLIPLIYVLQTRFILKEEARLRDAFGDEFRKYADRVRRWL